MEWVVCGCKNGPHVKNGSHTVGPFSPWYHSTTQCPDGIRPHFQPLVSLYYPVPGLHPPSLSAFMAPSTPPPPHLMVAHKQQWPPLWDEAQTLADLPGLGVRREEHGADLHKSGKGEGG